MNIKKENKSIIGPLIFIIIIVTDLLLIFKIFFISINKEKITNEIIIGIVVLIVITFLISNYYVRKLLPKSSLKWREIEHGSNEFQTKEEKQEFLKNCTDEKIDLLNDEIQKILLFIGEEKK